MVKKGTLEKLKGTTREVELISTETQGPSPSCYEWNGRIVGPIHTDFAVEECALQWPRQSGDVHHLRLKTGCQLWKIEWVDLEPCHWNPANNRHDSFWPGSKQDPTWPIGFFIYRPTPFAQRDLMLIDAVPVYVKLAKTWTSTKSCKSTAYQRYSIRLYTIYGKWFALKNWQARCQFNLAHKLKKN